MRYAMRKALVLGARDDPYPVFDFDGRGPRSIKLLSSRDDVASGAWVVSASPPVPDRRGNDHGHVLLVPRRREESLKDLRRGTVVRVGVRPAPAADTPSDVAWYHGEVARTTADLSPTPAESFARRWPAYQRWVAAFPGNPVPPETEEFAGVAVGRFVLDARRLYAAGALPAEQVQLFESVPGWEWFADDEIGLVSGYALREGSLDIPEDHVEGGRLLARTARALASSYIDATDVNRLAETRGMPLIGRVFMTEADMHRLDALPGWPEWVDSVRKSRFPFRPPLT